MVEQNSYGEQIMLWKDDSVSWESFSPEIREEVRRLIVQLLKSELLKNKKEDNDRNE